MRVEKLFHSDYFSEKQLKIRLNSNILVKELAYNDEQISEFLEEIYNKSKLDTGKQESLNFKI